MANLVQLKMTDFYCSATEFSDQEYHFTRLWKSTLFLFKVKVFKLMYHHARVQASRREGQFPDRWYAFGASLHVSHPLHPDTFRSLMQGRDLSIEELQKAGYAQMSTQDIELFDQGSADQFLAAVFTLKEMTLAAGQVHDLVRY